MKGRRKGKNANKGKQPNKVVSKSKLDNVKDSRLAKILELGDAGRIEEAEVLLKEYEASLGRPMLNSGSDRLFQEGQNAFRSGNKDEALRLYRLHLEEVKVSHGVNNERCAFAYSILATTLFSMDRVKHGDESLLHFRKAFQLFSKYGSETDVYFCEYNIAALEENLETLLRCYDRAKTCGHQSDALSIIGHLIPMTKDDDNYTPRLYGWLQDLKCSTGDDVSLHLLEADILLKVGRCDLFSELVLKIQPMMTQPSAQVDFFRDLLERQVRILNGEENGKLLSGWRMCFCCDAFKKRKEIQKCGCCKLSYYCDEKCQLQDWPEHKKSCAPRKH